MSETNLVQKLKILEKDIAEIKKYLGLGVFKKDLDVENWQKLKKISRKIRRELFKERYPRLYEKSRKEK